MKYIAIMAGGIGSRFWPESTEKKPKQFLDILDNGKSLLQMAFERALPLCPAERILVVTNRRYKELILGQLPALSSKNILCEPSMNNTGPSVAYTALHLQARDPEACFAIVSSDHVIKKESEYLKLMTQAFNLAENSSSIVTLGISPTRPDTGYGYIEFEEEKQKSNYHPVKAFKEKPDLETAKTYLKSGKYLWNAGIFIWRAETVINAFDKYEPEITTVLKNNLDAFGSDHEQEYINEVYPKTPSISVDYAILEKYPDILTIPADIDWSDLGTWNSLYQFLPKDESKNVLQAEKIQLSKTKNSIIRIAGDKTVVIKGLEDYIVINNDDALLIYPKSDEQEIKQVVKSLKSI